MAGLEGLKKAVAGDPANETIKSGTLVTTRGIGVVAVGLIGVFLLMDQLGEIGPWKDMSNAQKLAFVVAAGAIWAVVAAADAIARGLAAATTRATVTSMPPGLIATRTTGVDSPGWRVAAVQTGRSNNMEETRFLIIKGDKFDWVSTEELSFP